MLANTALDAAIGLGFHGFPLLSEGLTIPSMITFSTADYPTWMQFLTCWYGLLFTVGHNTLLQRECRRHAGPGTTGWDICKLPMPLIPPQKPQ